MALDCQPGDILEYRGEEDGEGSRLLYEVHNVQYHRFGSGNDVRTEKI